MKNEPTEAKQREFERLYKAVQTLRAELAEYDIATPNPFGEEPCPFREHCSHVTAPPSPAKELARVVRPGE